MSEREDEWQRAVAELRIIRRDVVGHDQPFLSAEAAEALSHRIDAVMDTLNHPSANVLWAVVRYTTQGDYQMRLFRRLVAAEEILSLLD
jgi:hypothetical protein